MTHAKIKIHPFGTFRAIADEITVTIPSQATVTTVKQAIISVIGDTHRTLVSDSVLATDTMILQDTDTIGGATELSILPPVCGG